MSQTVTTSTNAGATGAALFLALALTWVFGIVASFIYHGLGGGFLALLIGAVMAFASGYGAVAIAASSVQSASLGVIKFAVIAMTAINFFMYWSRMGAGSILAAICSMIGAAMVSRSSATAAAKY